VSLVSEQIHDVEAFLDSLIKRVTDWDRNLVEQAVYAFGLRKTNFSTNDFRHLLPELAHGHVGIVIRSMARRRLISQAVDENRYPITVKSTAASTHGKEVNVYGLTAAGVIAAREMLRKSEAAA
jgi:hypothetical protein